MDMSENQREELATESSSVTANNTTPSDHEDHVLEAFKKQLEVSRQFQLAAASF